MSKRTSWRKKLNNSKGLPKVVAITDTMSRRWGSGTVVIPSPKEVDALMKKIPKGKVITLRELRAHLAERHGATIGCPMTTGIFAWIAAHAANEEESEGISPTTPYWRTLKSGGELNPKYPGGIQEQKARLQSEGHTILEKGKRFFVKEHEKYLHTL